MKSKNEMNSRTEKKSAKRLVFTFFSLTLLIFSVYFGLIFINGTSAQKNPLQGENQIDGLQSEAGLTEIQEKILEKLKMQVDLIEYFSSVDEIDFEPQISNKKIVGKLITEIQGLFKKAKNGKFLISVDIFNDESSPRNSESESENIEYSGSDTNIVLQISIIDKKTRNKLGEVGVMIPMKMLVIEPI